VRPIFGGKRTVETHISEEALETHRKCNPPTISAHDGIIIALIRGGGVRRSVVYGFLFFARETQTIVIFCAQTARARTRSRCRHCGGRLAALQVLPPARAAERPRRVTPRTAADRYVASYTLDRAREPAAARYYLSPAAEHLLLPPRT